MWNLIFLFAQRVVAITLLIINISTHSSFCAAGGDATEATGGSEKSMLFGSLLRQIEDRSLAAAITERRKPRAGSSAPTIEHPAIQTFFETISSLRTLVPADLSTHSKDSLGAFRGKIETFVRTVIGETNLEQSGFDNPTGPSDWRLREFLRTQNFSLGYSTTDYPTIAERADTLFSDKTKDERAAFIGKLIGDPINSEISEPATKLQAVKEKYTYLSEAREAVVRDRILAWYIACKGLDLDTDHLIPQLLSEMIEFIEGSEKIVYAFNRLLIDCLQPRLLELEVLESRETVESYLAHLEFLAKVTRYGDDAIAAAAKDTAPIHTAIKDSADAAVLRGGSHTAYRDTDHLFRELLRMISAFRIHMAKLILERKILPAITDAINGNDEARRRAEEEEAAAQAAQAARRAANASKSEQLRLLIEQIQTAHKEVLETASIYSIKTRADEIVRAIQGLARESESIASMAIREINEILERATDASEIPDESMESAQGTTSHALDSIRPFNSEIRLLVENAAAGKIQSAWRGYKARQQYKKIIAKQQAERTTAATKIQSAWRGHKARRFAAELRAAQEMRNQAAQDIQRVWRGHSGRKKASTVRDAKKRDQEKLKNLQIRSFDKLIGEFDIPAVAKKVAIVTRKDTDLEYIFTGAVKSLRADYEPLLQAFGTILNKKELQALADDCERFRDTVVKNILSALIRDFIAGVIEKITTDTREELSALATHIADVELLADLAKKATDTLAALERAIEDTHRQLETAQPNEFKKVDLAQFTDYRNSLDVLSMALNSYQSWAEFFDDQPELIDQLRTHGSEGEDARTKLTDALAQAQRQLIKTATKRDNEEDIRVTVADENRKIAKILTRLAKDKIISDSVAAQATRKADSPRAIRNFHGVSKILGDYNLVTQTKQLSDLIEAYIDALQEALSKQKDLDLESRNLIGGSILSLRSGLQSILRKLGTITTIRELQAVINRLKALLVGDQVWDAYIMKQLRILHKDNSKKNDASQRATMAVFSESKPALDAIMALLNRIERQAQSRAAYLERIESDESAAATAEYIYRTGAKKLSKKAAKYKKDEARRAKEKAAAKLNEEEGAEDASTVKTLSPVVSEKTTPRLSPEERERRQKKLREDFLETRRVLREVARGAATTQEISDIKDEFGVEDTKTSYTAAGLDIDTWMSRRKDAGNRLAREVVALSTRLSSMCDDISTMQSDLTTIPGYTPDADSALVRDSRALIATHSETTGKSKELLESSKVALSRLAAQLEARTNALHNLLAKTRKPLRDAALRTKRDITTGMDSLKSKGLSLNPENQRRAVEVIDKRPLRLLASEQRRDEGDDSVDTAERGYVPLREIATIQRELDSVLELIQGVLDRGADRMAALHSSGDARPSELSTIRWQRERDRIGEVAGLTYGQVKPKASEFTKVLNTIINGTAAVEALRTLERDLQTKLKAADTAAKTAPTLAAVLDGLFDQKGTSAVGSWFGDHVSFRVLEKDAAAVQSIIGAEVYKLLMRLSTDNQTDLSEKYKSSTLVEALPATAPMLGRTGSASAFGSIASKAGRGALGERPSAAAKLSPARVSDDSAQVERIIQALTKHTPSFRGARAESKASDKNSAYARAWSAVFAERGIPDALMSLDKSTVYASLISQAAALGATGDALARGVRGAVTYTNPVGPGKKYTGQELFDAVSSVLSKPLPRDGSPDTVAAASAREDSPTDDSLSTGTASPADEMAASGGGSSPIVRAVEQSLADDTVDLLTSGTSFRQSFNKFLTLLGQRLVPEGGKASEISSGVKRALESLSDGQKRALADSFTRAGLTTDKLTSVRNFVATSDKPTVDVLKAILTAE